MHRAIRKCVQPVYLTSPFSGHLGNGGPRKFGLLRNTAQDIDKLLKVPRELLLADS